MGESSKPVIIHAAGFQPSSYGGNFVASMCALETLCRKQGWMFVLALPAGAAKRGWCKRLIETGFQVRFLPNKASVLASARALVDLSSCWNAALIHTHFSEYDVAAWAASRFLRLRGRKLSVVWHAHSDFPVRMTLLRRAKDLLKYRFMGRTVRMIAVSEHLRRQIIKAGFSAAAIETVPNGIDLKRAVDAVRSRAQVYEDLSIPPDKHLLLLFGWEPAVKGVDIAMDAVYRLVDFGFPVILGIVGMSDLKAYVSRRTNGEQPSWLHIIPPTDNVADLYQAASVFISASRNEGFPYSVGEAMANGLPVVLSDLSGVFWAREASGAILFPSGDSSALAEALREVLNWSVVEREKNAIANKRLVETKYDVTNWADRILRQYREILRQNY